MQHTGWHQGGLSAIFRRLHPSALKGMFLIPANFKGLSQQNTRTCFSSCFPYQSTTFASIQALDLQAASPQLQYVLCVDDDVSLHPSTIRECVTALLLEKEAFMLTGKHLRIERVLRSVQETSLTLLLTCLTRFSKSSKCQLMALSTYHKFHLQASKCIKVKALYRYKFSKHLTICPFEISVTECSH